MAWKMAFLMVTFMVLGLKKSFSKGPEGLVLLPTIPFPLSKIHSLAVPFPSRDAGPCNPRPPVSPSRGSRPCNPGMFWKEVQRKIFRRPRFN